MMTPNRNKNNNNMGDKNWFSSNKFSPDYPYISNFNNEQREENDNKQLNESESMMWREFQSHFKHRHRKGYNTAANHHDFIDLPNINESEVATQQILNKIRQQGGRSFASEYLIANERIMNKRKQLQSMRLRSIQIPLGPRSTASKRFKNSHFQTPLYAPKKVNSSVMEEYNHSQIRSPIVENKQKIQNQNREYQDHSIFIILDGQNIFDQDLKFTYVEIAERLARMIPKKIWDLKTADKLNLYERLNIASPAYILQKQNLMELLQDISQKLNEDLQYLFTLSGKRIKTLVQVPAYTKVLIVSSKKHCKGLSGLDTLELKVLGSKSHRNHHQEPNQNSHREDIENNNQIQSWLQTACISWMKKHKPNDPIRSGHASAINLSPVRSGANDMADDIHNIQNQDQRLLDGFYKKRNTGSAHNNSGQKTMQNFSQDKLTKQQSFKMSGILQLWNEIYINETLEEEIVRIICEKVVKMRERSLQKTAQNLLKSLEPEKSVIGTAKPASNSRQPKTPYTINKLALYFNKIDSANNSKYPQSIIDPNYQTNFSFFSKDQTDVTKGKITFKNRVTSQPPAFGQADFRSRKRPSMGEQTVTSDIYSNKNTHNQQTPQMNQGSSKLTEKILKNEEIKQICEKHYLSRKEVYDIRSQFVSMSVMSDDTVPFRDPFTETSASGWGHNDNSSRLGKQSTGNAKDQDGININYFIKNCSFLSGTLPHICKRILVALGLDIENPNAKVNWTNFLELYCIFEAGKIEKEQLSRFWIKFFDQKLMGTVSRDEYLTILEELVRGNSLKKANKTTKMFAKMFQKMLENQKCLGDNQEIVCDKLYHAFMNNEIDIQVLCSALGRQKLDESLMKIKL